MKRIYINESKLRRLIESAINELDIRTKLSAAEKAYNNNEKALDARVDNSSPNNFAKSQAQAAAQKSYRQHGAFMGGLENDIDKHFKRRFGATRNPEDRFYNLGHLKRQYRGDSVDTGVHDSKDDLNKTFDDYFKRKAYYDDGKWRDTRDSDWDEEKAKAFWNKNEAIVRQVTENVVRVIKESQEQEEPYLWIEVSHYDDGSEEMYQLDDLVAKNVDARMPSSELEKWDYSYGETPDDLFEYLVSDPYSGISTIRAESDDGYYVLVQGMMGDYSLLRKVYLGEIIKAIEQNGELPSRVSGDAREFVKEYCPQFMG